jgi:hypothetical protein
MKRLSLTGLVTVLSVIAILVFCTILPVNQSADPSNAEVVLFSDKGDFDKGISAVTVGDSLMIGLRMVYPKHFQMIRITSSCSCFQKTMNHPGFEPGF